MEKFRKLKNRHTPEWNGRMIASFLIMLGVGGSFSWGESLVDTAKSLISAATSAAKEKAILSTDAGAAVKTSEVIKDLLHRESVQKNEAGVTEVRSENLLQSTTGIVSDILTIEQQSVDGDGVTTIERTNVVGLPLEVVDDLMKKETIDEHGVAVSKKRSFGIAEGLDWIDEKTSTNEVDSEGVAIQDRGLINKGKRSILGVLNQNRVDENGVSVSAPVNPLREVKNTISDLTKTTSVDENGVETTRPFNPIRKLTHKTTVNEHNVKVQSKRSVFPKIFRGRSKVVNGVEISGGKAVNAGE